MKSILYLACLLVGLLKVAAEQQGPSSATPAKEPVGGLFAVALKSAELGERWTRQVRLALDPQVEPNPYYPSKYDMPG